MGKISLLTGILFILFNAWHIVAILSGQNTLGLIQRLTFYSFHILFFSVTLSVSHHAVWEVWEYTFDCIFHQDNQRWQKVSASNNQVSESAIQPAGLVDTMNDIIFCMAGTPVACIAWYFVL